MLGAGAERARASRRPDRRARLRGQSGGLSVGRLSQSRIECLVIRSFNERYAALRRRHARLLSARQIAAPLSHSRPISEHRAMAANGRHSKSFRTERRSLAAATAAAAPLKQILFLARTPLARGQVRPLSLSLSSLTRAVAPTGHAPNKLHGATRRGRCSAPAERESDGPPRVIVYA